MKHSNCMDALQMEPEIRPAVMLRVLALVQGLEYISGQHGKMMSGHDSFSRQQPDAADCCSQLMSAQEGRHTTAAPLAGPNIAQLPMSI